MTKTAAKRNLDALRTEHEALRLRVEAQAMRDELRAVAADRVADSLESYDDAADNFVDVRDYLPDRYLRPSGAWTSRITDRDEGQYSPVFQSEQELAFIRGVARGLVDGNGMASGTLEALADYTIDKGFKYQVGSTDREHPEADAELVRTAQSIVDVFLDDNDWPGDLDRELFCRAETDGESFCGLWHRGGGCVAARAIEPDQVTEPSSPRQIEDWLDWPLPSSWSFGIHTDADDTEERHGCYVQWSANSTDWDYLPAGARPAVPPGPGQDVWVEHYKVGTPRNVKRGLSAFFGTRKQFDLAQKLLRNIGEGASIQSAIAFFRKHAAGITNSQILAFRRARGAREFSESAITGARTNYVQQFHPGTIVDSGAGIDYMYGPLGQNNAPIFIQVVDVLLRTAGVRWRIPQHIITGTPEAANYAGILVAESPFVKATQVRQSRLIRSHLRILWKVLEFAYRAGRFGQIPWQTLLARLEIQVEPPQVAVRDPDKETARRKVLRDAGIMSDQTWSRLEGLDYNREQLNGARRIEGASAAPLPSHPETPRATDITSHPRMKEGSPLKGTSDAERNG